MPAIFPTHGPALSAMKRTFRSPSGKLTCDNGMITVTHHACDVAVFNDTSITLRNNGWNSVTTRQRLNKILAYFGFPMHVTSRKWNWYVETPYGEIAFHDNMWFTRDGFYIGQYLEDDDDYAASIGIIDYDGDHPVSRP